MDDPRRWKIEDEDAFEGQDDQQVEERRTLFGSPVRIIAEVGLLLILAFGIWQVWLFQSQQSDSTLVNLVQGILDLEREAILEGNGELFLSLQAVDPAWQAVQLRPVNQSIIRSEPKVTFAEQFENIIWTRISWKSEDEVLSRVAFFENSEGRLLHSPTAPTNFWGSEWQDQYPWGLLIYRGGDDEWAGEIGQFVSDTIATICAVSCLESRISFNLVVATDYAETAAFRNLRILSPQLVALDEKGEPAALFWEMLEDEIKQYITPATINFAVFPNITPPRNPIYHFEALANDFMEENPEITIELILINEIPDDLSSVAMDYDGAGIQPTEQMLATGLVRDLTAFMYTDASFDRADYYEQIFRGAEWRNRFWSVPYAASMPLIFYDRDAYLQADTDEPGLGWTWDQLDQDIETIVDQAKPEAVDLQWGFLDTGLDILFSRAFHWDLYCSERAVILCHNPLLPTKVAASLEWYAGYSGVPERMPSIAALQTDPSKDLILNFQGARRQAAIWVDIPVNYEHLILLNPVGIVSFPGSEEVPGITPLSVYGGFISQNSRYPLAVWEWLKYLSNIPPSGRLIPARPSVANSSGFWVTLPPTLSEPMIYAFPFSQPIRAEDMTALSWDQISTVVTGELSPLEAAMDAMNFDWFGGTE